MLLHSVCSFTHIYYLLCLINHDLRYCAAKFVCRNLRAFRCKFFLTKSCLCKENDKYKVWLIGSELMQSPGRASRLVSVIVLYKTNLQVVHQCSFKSENSVQRQGQWQNLVFVEHLKQKDNFDGTGNDQGIRCTSINRPDISNEWYHHSLPPT